MLELKTKADLQRLVDEGLEESLILDYKASPSLSRDGKSPEELCKDVSALANSAGGQLIYGIEENKAAGKPSKVDDGVADAKITKEWIEQILNSKVQPRMDGVRIERIDMETGKFGYVISVQQSQTGPHQAPDGKYYKRFNFQSVPMQDYEIKDVMRRSTTPHLRVGLAFRSGLKTKMSLQPNQEVSEPFSVLVSVENLSSTPALYSMLTIGLDSRLIYRDASKVLALGRYRDKDGIELSWYRRNFAVPTDLPIFKETSIALPDATFTLSIPVQPMSELTIRTVVETPGYSASEDWTLLQLAGTLELYRD